MALVGSSEDVKSVPKNLIICYNITEYNNRRNTMLKVCSKTDIGRKRSINQDCVYSCSVPIGNLSNLFIVADGMGGHKAGDYASAYTVNCIEREVEASEKESPVKILSDAIKCANEEIFKKATSEEDFSGMGTTVVASTVVDSTMYVANVGDSRLYLLNDSIKQITRDHSLVEEMIRIGEIKREDARLHPDKNIITRAVGAEPQVMIDFFEIDLKEGDVVLMCSDGLTNMVEDSEILSIVKAAKNIDQAANDLVKMANHNGGKDNIGIVLVLFEGVKSC